MPDTRWCPRCGGEYRAGFTTCADCGVTLVDEPPPPDPSSASAPIGGGEPVVYDVSEWPVEWRDSLEWMLGGRNIPFQWDSEGILVVPSGTEETVDGFIDYIAAGDPDADDPEEDAPEFVPGEQMTIDEFYDADPRRRASDEVELGMDWTDEDGFPYEVSWVRDTGELFLMGAEDGTSVEVLDVLPDIDEVERVLDGWQEAIDLPNSVAWVRDRVRSGVAPEPAVVATAEPPVVEAHEEVDEWVPPAAIGWVAPDLDALAARYSELRRELGPDGAMAQAMDEVLDAGSCERLTEFFAGEKDVVYGTGAGATARTEMRDALERRASG